MIIEPIANSNNQQSNVSVISEVHFKEGMNKTIKERPIEDVGNETSKKAGDETTTKTIIDKNKVLVFTRYDEEGNVVNKVPPGYVAEA
jgi:hypothetical protein